MLPDDTAHLLTRLIKGGNKYELFIKSVRVNALSVLIRETFRSKRFKNQPSFLDTVGYVPRLEIITPIDSDGEEQDLDEEEEQIV